MDTETRCAQIEKEMLSWSVEKKFNHYTYGQKVNVVSDHILKKGLANAPKRLQGMMMRLHKYDVDLMYVPGKNVHFADTLSRAHRPTMAGPHKDFEHVHVEGHVPISESRLEAIRTATEADQVITALKQLSYRAGQKRGRTCLH